MGAVNRLPMLPLTMVKGTGKHNRLLAEPANFSEVVLQGCRERAFAPEHAAMKRRWARRQKCFCGWKT